MGKLRHNKRHTKERATQRLGIDLGGELYNKLIKQIQNNELRCVYRISNTRTAFATVIEGKEVHIIYNKDTKSIITIKTPEMY